MRSKRKEVRVIVPHGFDSTELDLRGRDESEGPGQSRVLGTLERILAHDKN